MLHLPVRGTGDGGAQASVADVHALWSAAAAGAIVPPDLYAAMTHPSSASAPGSERYGLGFWLHPHRDNVVALEGADAGVSFRSVHDAQRQLTYTVIANSSHGAWPLARLLARALSD